MDVEYPVGDDQEVCAVCGEPFKEYDPEFASGYANLICIECDAKAVDEDGDSIEYTTATEADDGVLELHPPKGAKNPVFVDGVKCWRRYRFGGHVTFRDEFDCDSLAEFYDKHFPEDRL